MHLGLPRLQRQQQVPAMGTHRMLSCRLSVAVGHRLGRPIILEPDVVEPCSVEPLSVFFLLGEQHPHQRRIGTIKGWVRSGKLGQSNRQHKHNTLCWIIRDTILVFANCK